MDLKVERLVRCQPHELENPVRDRRGLPAPLADPPHQSLVEDQFQARCECRGIDLMPQDGRGCLRGPRAWIAATTRQDSADSTASVAISALWISGRKTTSLPGTAARAARHLAASAGNGGSCWRIPWMATNCGESTDSARLRSAARCDISE